MEVGCIFSGYLNKHFTVLQCGTCGCGKVRSFDYLNNPSSEDSFVMPAEIAEALEQEKKKTFDTEDSSKVIRLVSYGILVLQAG